MNISDAIDEYLGCKRNSITHKTYIWYEARLDFFLAWAATHGYCNLAQITAPLVAQCVASLPSTNSYTRHGYAQVIKGFLNWCALDEEYGVRERAVKRIEMPKLEINDIYLFSDKDIDHLLSACDNTAYPLRAKAIVHVFLDTGIRVSELAYDSTRPQEQTGLRMENLFLSSRRHDDAHIRVMGKGWKSRTIGIGQETCLALSRYLHRERGHGESPYVFLSRRGNPFSVRSCEQFISDLGKSVGIVNCHPHLFRHSFAVRSLMNGVSELVLMKLLGHTSLEATKVYVRALSEWQARQSAPSVIDTMRSKGRKKGPK